jgi:hypothetical protein
VSTRSLTVEVEDVFAGKEDDEITISEIEVFGTRGKRRAPLDIDVRSAVVRFDSAAWGRSGGGAAGTAADVKAASSWIEIVDGKGGARRLFKGTGIVGLHGDCYLLVEKITGASCSVAYLGFKGSYTLVDIENRLYYETGSLGGLGSMVYRRLHEGGYATTSVNPDGEVSVGALFIEKGKFRLRKEIKPSALKAGDVLRVWGFEPEGKACCDFGDPEERERVCAPVKAEDAVQAIGSLAGQDWREIVQFSKDNPRAAWNVCSEGKGPRVIVSSIHECDEVPNVAAVIDKSGKVQSSLFGSTMRIAVLPGGGLLIEVRKRGSTSSDIYTVDDGGEITRTYPDAAFSIGPPPACRCGA